MVGGSSALWAGGQDDILPKSENLRHELGLVKKLPQGREGWER
jgi:hypothetical protein